jgi:transcriptional regulator with XRE-family HTH domain
MAARKQPSTALAVYGDKIRQLRKERGIEVAGLAEMVGCSRSHMARIELDDLKRVSPTLFARICDELDLSADQRRALILTDEQARRRRLRCQRAQRVQAAA